MSYGPFQDFDAATDHIAEIFLNQFPTREELAKVLATVAIKCGSFYTIDLRGRVVIRGFVDQLGNIIRPGVQPDE